MVSDRPDGRPTTGSRMTTFSHIREDARTVLIPPDDIGGLGLEIRIVTGRVTMQAEGPIRRWLHPPRLVPASR